MTEKTRAYIGIGANLGDPVKAVQEALKALASLPESRLLAASRLYRTPAWGNEDQPDFINAAATLETTLPAPLLLEQLLETEHQFGRQRLPGERWGPRTLDLDLLLYGSELIDLPQLKVPHPHLHERAFALKPLLDIATDAVIPGHGLARELPAAMAADGIEAVG